MSSLIKTATKKSLQRMCQERNLDASGLRMDLEMRLQRYFEENATQSEDSPDDETLPQKSLGTASAKVQDSDFLNKQVKSTANLAINVKRAVHWDAVVDTGKRVRKVSSSALAVITLIEIHEMFWLLKTLIPQTLKVDLEYLPTMNFPDLFILLSPDFFWKPFSLWLTTCVVIPTITASFVNPQYKQHKLDPVTFSLTKLVLTYILFAKQWPFALGVFKAAISPDLLWLGSAIGLVYAFYEAAILPRR